MPYFISYTLTDDSPSICHSAIAITYCGVDDDKPVLIIKIGLNDFNQIRSEVGYRPGKFFYKTYPISESELTDVFIKINKDRSIAQSSATREERDLYYTRIKSSNEKDSKEEKETKEEKIYSRPGGVVFSGHKNNCKKYAISLLRKAGIVDDSLENPLFPYPLASGHLYPMEIIESDNKKFLGSMPLTVHTRKSYKSFTHKELEDLNQLQASGKITVARSAPREKRIVSSLSGFILFAGAVSLVYPPVTILAIFVVAISALVGAKIGHSLGSRNSKITNYNFFNSRKRMEDRSDMRTPLLSSVKITKKV